MAKPDARKYRDSKVTKKTFSFKTKDPELLFLVKVYCMRHQKEFTIGEYIENLIREDLKDKKERGELDDIYKERLKVLEDDKTAKKNKQH